MKTVGANAPMVAKKEAEKSDCLTCEGPHDIIWNAWCGV